MFGLDNLFAFIFTFSIGSLGYFVCKLFKIPNPALLGSMLATGALNIAGHYPPFPTWFVSFCANVAIGIMLGRQIDRNVLKRMKALSKHVVYQVAGILTLSLVCGYTFYLTSDVSLKTALISGTAGGLTEMIVFGMSVDADIAVIAFMQLFRIVVFVTLIPYLSMVAEKFGEKREPVAITEGNGEKIAVFRRSEYFMLVPCALFGAWCGRVLRIPAGQMLGAMLAGGALAVFLNRKYLYDLRIRYVAQIGLGLVMGSRMTSHMVAQLAKMLLPAVLVTSIMLAGCTLLAYLLYKRTDWDLTTCLLCSAPAGLSQITVFAEEIGADSFTASVFHTVRIIGIVSLYPWIILPFV